MPQNLYKQEPQLVTSAPRHLIIRWLYRLKGKLSQETFKLLLGGSFCAGWAIFAYSSSGSFNVADFIFSNVNNGALLDQEAYVLFFKTNTAQMFANLFGISFEIGSLAGDFFIASLEGKYLRIILAQNLDEKRRREIKYFLRSKMLFFKLLIVGVLFGYSALMFTGLGINLSSDMSNFSLSENPFATGQISTDIIHLPSSIWQRVVVGSKAIGLGLCNMYLIPQLITGVTLVFISEVLQQEIKDKIWEDLDNFFQKRIRDIKNSDFWKNKK